MPKTKLKELSEEQFESIKKIGLLWEFYPDAPENFYDLGIRQEVECINSQIETLRETLVMVRGRCKHENHTKKPGSSTGNMDPDEYWSDFKCNDCGHRWAGNRTYGGDIVIPKCCGGPMIECTEQEEATWGARVYYCPTCKKEKTD
jgi:hypothetical protein